MSGHRYRPNTRMDAIASRNADTVQCCPSGAQMAHTETADSCTLPGTSCRQSSLVDARTSTVSNRVHFRRGDRVWHSAHLGQEGCRLEVAARHSVLVEADL